MTPEDMITGGPALQLDATLFSTLRVHRVPNPPLSTPVVKLYAIVRNTVNPHDPADDSPRFQHRIGAAAVGGGNSHRELSGTGSSVPSSPHLPALESSAGNTSAREDPQMSACAVATHPAKALPVGAKPVSTLSPTTSSVAGSDCNDAMAFNAAFPHAWFDHLSQGEPGTPQVRTCFAGTSSKKQRPSSASATQSCTSTMDGLSSACEAEHDHGCKDASGHSSLLDPVFPEVKL